MIIRNRNSTSSTVCNCPQKILHQDRMKTGFCSAALFQLASIKSVASCLISNLENSVNTDSICQLKEVRSYPWNKQTNNFSNTIIRNRNSTSSTVCNGPQKILHQDRNENRLLLSSIVPARFNKICCPCKPPYAGTRCKIIWNRNSTSSTVCNGPQKILHQDRNENRLLLSSIVPARFNKICCPCVWTGSQPKAFFNWVQKKRCDYTPDYKCQSGAELDDKFNPDLYRILQLCAY